MNTRHFVNVFFKSTAAQTDQKEPIGTPQSLPSPHTVTHHTAPHLPQPRAQDQPQPVPGSAAPSGPHSTPWKDSWGHREPNMCSNCPGCITALGAAGNQLPWKHTTLPFFGYINVFPRHLRPAGIRKAFPHPKQGCGRGLSLRGGCTGWGCVNAVNHLPRVKVLP